jgi:hypothetical protein
MSLQIDKPLIVGSRDNYWLRFVDVYVNQATGVETTTAIDLDTYTTVELMIAFGTDPTYGAWTTKTMTKDADQTTRTGYASYAWAADDLTAGDMKVRGKLTDSGSLIFYTDLIYETVEAL